MAVDQWTAADIPDLAGRTAVVTGQRLQQGRATSSARKIELFAISITQFWIAGIAAVGALFGALLAVLFLYALAAVALDVVLAAVGSRQVIDPVFILGLGLPASPLVATGVFIWMLRRCWVDIPRREAFVRRHRMCAANASIDRARQSLTDSGE